MDELFGPIVNSNLKSAFSNFKFDFDQANLKFEISIQNYSSVFFFFLRKALPSFDFDPVLVAFFCGLPSAAGVSLFGATRFARGAAAAPPRLARLLTAGFTSLAFRSCFHVLPRTGRIGPM